MELKEQIIKQMQGWCDNMCENACLKGESLNGKIHTCEICFPNTVKNALSLIKELTEENEAWQKQLIATEEKSGKAYYELACEVEDLRAIAEQYQKQFEEAKADTIRKMQERLKKAFNFGHTILEKSICDIIDQIAKEMLEEG